jgi:hypothetical protein
MKHDGAEIALLGLIADHQRKIKPGLEYDKYFPKAAGTEKMVTYDGTVQDTIKTMDKMVFDTLPDTAKIAPLLKGKTLAETCENIWNFIYNHIQYKLDREGVEELRRPRRTWSMDRTTGVDCDCMSLFAGSILANLNIPFKFRVTKYSAQWQHVYVIVPLPEEQSKYYVIDCVLNSFNEEKPYTGKFDHTMKTATLSGIPIAMLGSVGDATAENSDELKNILNGTHFNISDNLQGLGDVDAISKKMLDKFLDHLVATRDYIAKNPDPLVLVGGAGEHLKMLDYAIKHWNTPQRDAALDALAKQEDKWNAINAPVSGVGDTAADDEMLYVDGIGEIGKFSLKKVGNNLFNAVKAGVKSVEVVAKKVADTAKTDIKAAGATLKAGLAKVGKFLVKYNPLTLLMRAGILAAMHVNLFGMAERLLPGLLSQSEAAAKGVPASLWQKSKDGYEKVAQEFEKIGGDRKKLEKHIREGRAGKKKNLAGFGTLGDPLTATAIISAAIPILSMSAKMSDAGVSASKYKAAASTHAKAINGSIGDDTATDTPVPESEIQDTDSSGKVVEDKKGIAKIIEAIKKFFSKNPQAEAAVDTASIKKEEETAAALDPANATPDDSTTPSGDGFFAKAGNFVKNNPGITAGIGIGVTAIAAFVFSPKFRAMLGFGAKKKPALSGVGCTAPQRKKTPPKKLIASKDLHFKRIELKH